MFRKLGKIFTNRIVIFLLLTAIELAIFGTLIFLINKGSPYFYILFIFFSILTLIEILGRDTYPEYKIAWSIVITCLPGFGFIFYLFLGRKVISKKKQLKYVSSNRKLHSFLYQNTYTLMDAEQDSTLIKCTQMVKEVSDFPICRADNVKYYPVGEDFFNALKQSLMSAKRFIFMEYFIIEKGQMWNELLDILTQKAKSGVEVRLIYDDFGSLLNLPRRYPKKLEALGIKAMRFNRIVPLLDARANIRNHRKITVIDGNIAYVGGANLADEYINAVERFGHWKDCAASFEGRAVNNFTISVLQTWASEHPFEDPSPYLNQSNEKDSLRGFILPYQDSPLLKLNVAQSLFLELIYSAKSNINISTPYLILNAELKTALIAAAKAGIRVNILVPHKPDKKTIYQLTKAFSAELTKHGVNVYEYMPGFNHQKAMVVDGKYAIVGTSNFDLRSLYTNYECGILVKEHNFVKNVETDFNKMFKVSKMMQFKKPNIFVRTYRSLLRIFAPLM